MDEFDNVNGSGSLSILPPSDDDNIGAAYSRSVEADQAASDDAWLNGLIGVDPGKSENKPAEGVSPPAGDLPSAADVVRSGGAPEPESDALKTAIAQSISQGGQDERSTAGKIVDGVGAVVGDVARGLSEAGPQVIGGVMDAIDEAGQFIEGIMPDLPVLQITDPQTGEFDLRFMDKDEFFAKGGESLFQALKPDEADSVTGGFVRSTSQFLAGFLPATAALKAGGLAHAVANPAIAGFIADAVVFDPHEARLSTFLNEVPALEGLVPDYLAEADPEKDGEYEGRIKNAIEGLGLGLASDALFKAFKYYKAARRQRALAPDPDTVAEKAAKDQLEAAARGEFVDDVTDEQLAGLGSASAPAVIEAAPDETAAEAFKRVADASTRAERHATEKDVLGKLAAIREKFSVNGERDPMDEAIDALRGRSALSGVGPKRPVASIVKELGKIDPQSDLARELKAYDIVPRNSPGLFKKGGLKSLDNVPVSEQPIFMAAGVDDGRGYIPQDDWIRALADERKGNPWRAHGEVQIEADLNGSLDVLDEQFSRLGIDIDQMSNASIKERLAQIETDQALYERSIQDMGPRLFETGLGPDDPDFRADMGGAGDAGDAGAAGKLPKGKVYINHARISSADDVRAVLQQMADLDATAIDAKRRGVVSNSKTISESAREYRELNDLIGREPGPMTAAQAVAARRVLVSSGEQVAQLAKAAAKPDATKADIFAFRRAMSVHYAIQSEVIAARTETARALQSWSIPVGASKARTDAINEMIMAGGGAGDIQQLAKAVSSVGNNPQAVNAMARELGKGRFGKALYQVWINGLLSSPKTHMVNILSNAMVSAYAIPERYLAAGFSKVFYQGEIKAGEATASAYGMLKGIRDGFRLSYMGARADGVADLADVFDAFVKTEGVHGNAISAEAFGLDNKGGIARGVDLLGKFINLPGSALGAEDRFFKSIGYRMELQALAFREAAGEGLEGQAFAKRVADILADPPANLKAEAIDVAHIQTFTNQLGKIGQSFQGFVQKMPLMRVVLPFIRTPTNIMKYTFARTPLAYMSSKIRADVAAGGARAAQAHARIALGSMIMLTTADMAIEGTITGKGPLDPDQRRTKMQSGWQPYSVKIGDRWYQYSRLDPIGMMLGIGADIAELTASADTEQTEMIATAAVFALANNLASKTYATGIYDFIGAIDPSNPTNDPGRYLTDMAGSLAPYSSLLRGLTQAADPVIRETRGKITDADGAVDPAATYIQGLIDTMKKGIPGLSDELPPRRDLWGEVITRESGLGVVYDFLSPISSRADDPDPVDRVILENKIPVSAAPRHINGVALTPEQYSEFVELAGKPAKEHLDKLVASPGFKRLSDGPDGMKAEVVKNVLSTFKDQARAQMLLKHPDLREKTFNLKRRKAGLLLGKEN